ncbi:hypothetical protein CBOM_07043 [Ceraceosorus bombacis]|uniref:Uncharacterized protein n=1 Tax=Ceraceosorus bombacis TaxID=401625 RepID=A0A0P1BKU5_9BASI|nr:hypothetical protein CBOM_07043 [Ceraceosorus bombacis]
MKVFSVPALAAMLLLPSFSVSVIVHWKVQAANCAPFVTASSKEDAAKRFAYKCYAIFGASHWANSIVDGEANGLCTVTDPKTGSPAEAAKLIFDAFCWSYEN